MMKPTLFLTIVVALSACSGGATTSSPTPPPPPDSPTSSGPISPGDTPDQPSPSPVEPTPGLTAVAPIPWQEAIVGEDDRTVTLIFYTGLGECYGLDRVEVGEGKDEVTITLFTGSIPGAPMCAEIAVLASTTVTLEEPVGVRTIVDGATT